ncbi:MAG TPA: transcription-repair coupling factor [Polyangiaceae bacterium]|nr:transcription-repair coupling factor [Polyangiaceae bacterium]
MSAADSLANPALSLALPEDRRILTLRELSAQVLQRRGILHVRDASGAAPALCAQALCDSGAKHVVYVAPDLDRARRASADLSALSRGLPASSRVAPGSTRAAQSVGPLMFAATETSPYAEVHGDRRAAMARAATLFHIAAGLPFQFVVITASALGRRVVRPEVLRQAAIRIEAESELDLAQLASRLTFAGYLRTPVVEDPGTFAVRGGLLDVWPAGAEGPLRVELYGDLILTIRKFDPDDQRTIGELTEAWLPPAREAIIDAAAESRARNVLRDLCDRVDYPSTKARAFIEDLATGHAYFGLEGYLPAFHETVPLLDYFGEKAVVVIDDPPAVVRALREDAAQGREGEGQRVQTPHFGFEQLYTDESQIARALEQRACLAAHASLVAGSTATTGLDALEGGSADAPSVWIRDHGDLTREGKLARTTRGKAASLDPVITRITLWQDAGLSVIITARARTQAERVAALLSHRGVKVALWDPDTANDSQLSSVLVAVAPMARGAICPAERFVIVTEEEIFGQRTHRAPAKPRAARAMLEDLRALEPGDYVVHVDHGIGRYVGLERRQVGDVSVDLIVVEYGGGDKLFLPVYRLNQIEKFSGGDAQPKLDRLGGQTFSKTKAKVQQRVRQMADELLRLYAERGALQKDALPAPDDDYAAFEASFPYDETRDQTAAIQDVLKDLASERVMDRVVCGDVGFGKTEVALRAAFLCANSGRQVALLCPTTVLAQQHYMTFSQRLQDYPIRVKAMSRFQSRADQVETLKGLKDGSVDIVVGTHRLLSKDVHFKHLGLLVVDEEQRFGVTHKERIKQLRTSVDVLTLSATPIPRTLQLAVGGLRDMSIISTPPVDRRAIRTITSQFDPELVRQAVERELERGGQVFYVYNRVEGIYERAERLQALVPRARIAVGHGKLTEDVLERTMLDFVAGEYDILVATAIIESGLDIPRANTIIVDRADLFGLAQLYQLRGRVGRSSERAYCYLLVPPPSQLTDESRARLEALERHSELGSGIHIAALDMELRGAGDVLGAEQSGFAASVGFDLFCHMLEEATHELRGEPVVHEVDPELSLDVDALIPDNYVSDVGVRLSFYKRLASASDEAEVADIASELQDRFGEPPVEARRFVELMRLKTELRKLRVLGCEASERSVSLHLRDDTTLDPVKVGELVAQKKSPYRLTPDGRLTRRPLENETFADGLALADRMLTELARCLKTGS